MPHVTAAATDAQYRQIFEATTDGLVVNDPETGMVVEVNPAFCRMHGYAYEDLIGVHPTTFIHPDDHGLFARFMEAFHRGGSFVTLARDVRRDGSVFDVEVHARSFTFRGRPHILGVVRDVSEAARAKRLLEERVEERTRELATLASIARGVTESGDLREFVRTAIVGVHGLIGADGVALYLRQGALFTLQDAVGPTTAASIPAGDLDVLVRELGMRGSLLLWAEDDGDVARQATAARLRPPGAAVIVVPLVAGEDLLGFLAVHRVCTDHDGAPHVTELVQAVASQIAIAVTATRLTDTARAAAALDERHRIARDLHDAVSQTLFSATMHARAAELAVARAGLPDDDPAIRAVAEVAELTLGALAEMRSLIFELRPDALVAAGLGHALQKHAAAITARHRLPVRVEVPDERLRLPAGAEEELYRIGQEALANVVRHAGATRAAVELWRSETGVSLRVSDDGHGFEPAQPHAGHLGLRTMRERAERLGATLRIDSTPSGTSVSVHVPAGPEA